MAVLIFSANGKYTTKPTLAAANTASDAAGKRIKLTGAVTMTGNITLATDRQWDFEDVVVTTTGYTLACEGADIKFLVNKQVFTGTGTVTGLDEVRPTWWGAKADDLSASATLNTAAFRAAAAAMTPSGAFRMSGTKAYHLNDAVTFSGLIGGKIIGWGGRDNDDMCIKFDGVSAGLDAIVITKSFNFIIEQLSVSSFGATHPARYGIHLASDNTPPILQGTLLNPTVRSCSGAGIAVTGTVTKLEANQNITIINPWLEDNTVNYYQQCGNSQGNTIIGGGMGGTADRPDSPTDYNVRISGGSLKLINITMDGSNEADIFMATDSPASMFGGLSMEQIYSESTYRFFAMDNYPIYSGALSFRDINHTPDIPSVDLVDAVQIQYAGGDVTFDNCFFEHGNLNIADAKNVTLTNVTLDDGELLSGGGSPVWKTGGDLARFQPVTYAPELFAASASMVWSVDEADVRKFQYKNNGDEMHVMFNIQDTSISGTPDKFLKLRIPQGYETTAEQTTSGMFSGSDNGTPFMGLILTVPGESFLRLYRDGSQTSNWTASTNNTVVVGQITLRII
jgi:hypothetical protein